MTTGQQIITFVHKQCQSIVQATDQPNTYLCTTCGRAVPANDVAIMGPPAQAAPTAPVQATQAVPVTAAPGTPQNPIPAIPIAAAAPAAVAPKNGANGAAKVAGLMKDKGMGFGFVPNWIVLIIAILLIALRKALVSFWLSAPEADLALGGSLPLWTPKGIEIPFITVAPFGPGGIKLDQEATVNIAFASMALFLTLMENANKRTNQNSAHKVNLGLIFFLVAPLLVGWSSFIVAALGIFLMPRHRKGVTQFNQTLVGLVMGLYVIFNLLQVFLAKFFYSLAEGSNTVSQIIALLLDMETMRVIIFLIYAGSIIMYWFNKDNDGSTQATSLLFMIGWHQLYGVFPYLESSTNTELIWWTIIAIFVLTMIVEVYQGGSMTLFWFLLFLNVVFYYCAKGLGFTKVDPFTVSLATLVFLSMLLFFGSKSKSLKTFSDAITKWSGALVDLDPIPMKVPIDAAQLTFTPWIILLHLGLYA